MARRAKPEEPTTTQPPRLGRYIVGEELGRGRMGTVYAAHDPLLGRRVALKVVERDLVEPLGHDDTGLRLQREAQVMARLAHPNVVPVFEVGATHRVVFIAMELVEGVPLSRWLEQTTRSWREVVSVYLQAGRGLAAAHDIGIVHRDFKPENVLVGRDHRARVLDFGLALPCPLHAPERAGELAAWSAPEDTGASDRVVYGTPAYMAPEQHMGLPCDVRADQFSFCVALYEGLYRERPFAGRTIFALADEVLAGHIRPAPTGARVPGWLRAILLRGMSTDPAARYGSIRELLGAIVFTASVM
ncbi:MAG: serine/threonine protein kinase [Nannocystis sp.]|nr:serine/threonine protein kinase [Nannocystis sp.]